MTQPSSAQPKPEAPATGHVIMGERVVTFEGIHSDARRIASGLVDAGLAERRTDPNSRRSYLIYLTKEGRIKADSLPPVIKRVNDEVLAGLTATERQQVVDLLQKATGVASN